MRVAHFAKTLAISASAIVIIAAAPASVAQQTTTPGQVLDTLKLPEPKAQPLAPPPIEAEKSKAPAPQTTGSAKSVTLTAFDFRGNKVFASAELAALVSQFLNRPVALLDIYAAADVIADHYTSRGYTLASVNVPPQKISDGVVQLDIVEGYIGEVTVSEAGRRNPDRLKRYLNVQSGSVYRAADVEQGMLKLNELPGLTARATVRPGADYGTSDLVIRTSDDAVSGIVFTDNSGRKSIGENRTAAAVNFNNPTGLDDQVQFLGLVSSGSSLRYGSLTYNFPLGFGGTRMSASYGYADFEVRDIADLTGNSKNARLLVEHPFQRGAVDRLTLSAGVADTRSSTDLAGLGLPGTSITVLELGAAYNHTYTHSAVTQLNTTLATNFADQSRADLNTGSNVRGKQMARLEIDAVHLEPLPYRLTWIARVNGVWSPDPLSDPSSYSIGGPQSVRGFPPSEVRGDRGYFGQLTLQQRHQLGPVRFSPRVFVDSGKVSCVDAGPGCATDSPATAALETEQELTSYGAGFDLDWNRFSFKLDASDPQGSRVASDGRDSVRVFGTLSASF